MADSVPHPAVAVLVQYLREFLPVYNPTVSVASKFPRQSTPDRVVRVSRVGGSMSNLVTDLPLMLFECYARAIGGDTADVAAEKLAMDVRATLAASTARTTTGGAWLRRWTEAGCAPLDDPDQPDYARWQVTGTIGIATRRI